MSGTDLWRYGAALFWIGAGANHFIHPKFYEEIVPPPLCLRAGILQAIRRLNAGLGAAERIRIHLTDIDSPATAIRRHLIALAQRLRTASRYPGRQPSRLRDSKRSLS